MQRVTATRIGSNSTQEEVNALVREYGVPAEGQQFTWAELSATIGVERKSGRFDSVINAWRSMLYRDHNLHLISVHGVGLKVALPTERVRWCGSKSAAGVRSIIRSAAVAENTSEQGLTHQESALRRHLAGNKRMIELAMRTSPEAMKKNQEKESVA
jgi:hypothetical protein